VRDLERERGLADAGRAAEQEDHRTPPGLVVTPHQVAPRGARTEAALDRVVRDPAQVAPLDLGEPAPHQLALDVARHLERIVRVDRGGEQRLREHPLRERLTPRLAPYRDLGGERQARLRLEQVRVEQLVEHLDDRGLVDHAARAQPVAHGVRDAVRLLERHPAGHQRVDHDPAHERAADASLLLHPEPAVVRGGRRRGCARRLGSFGLAHRSDAISDKTRDLDNSIL
jgi:hypothetical protein